MTQRGGGTNGRTTGTNTAVAERVTPHNLEAERALLGAMLLSRDARTTALPHVTSEDFHRPTHAHIYDAIQTLHNADAAIDPVTVHQQLAELGGDQTTTVSDLITLIADTPATSNAASYAHIIRAAAHRRRLIGLAGELQHHAYQGDDPSSTLTQLADLGHTTSSAADRLRSQLLHGDAIKTIPPAEPLIDGILDRNSVAALYGRSNSGKSFVAIDWALHVATGAWWQGHAITKGTVLYIVAEGSQGLKDRVEAWQQNANIQTLGDIIWLPAAVNLFDETEAAKLTAIVKELAPTLVIIDTLARCMTGADENSARDMGHVVANLDQMRRATQACILAVHHTGKTAENGLRGSSALEGAVDTAIECRAGDDGSVELTETKQKNRQTGHKIKLHLAAVADSCALRPWGGAPDIDPETMPSVGVEVLRTLYDIDTGIGVSSTDWEASGKTPRASFFRWKKNLVGLNLVSDIGNGTRHRYTVTDQGKHALGIEKVSQVS